MDPQGKRSDRDSNPARFVLNSYFPEPPQYYGVNYHGSQRYYEEPQPQLLPQYNYHQPQVTGAFEMQNINSQNEVEVTEGANASG